VRREPRTRTSKNGCAVPGKDELYPYTLRKVRSTKYEGGVRHEPKLVTRAASIDEPCSIRFM